MILRWNDPRSEATTVRDERTKERLGVSAHRSPWANGGADGLEGDGPLFVRHYGIAAINRDLVSIERSDGGNLATPMSPKQLTAIATLMAYWFDQARVPWDSFPLHPASGCVTHLLHYDLTTRACPYPPVTDRIDELQDRVRNLLRLAQTGEGDGDAAPGPGPLPPHAPVRPDHAWWPQGYNLATLTARFAELIRREAGPPARTTSFGFNPRGVIANAWVARGVQEQRTAAQLPRARTWWSLREGKRQRDLVSFDDGWLLFHPHAHVVWRWLE